MKNNEKTWKYKWAVEVLFITFGLSLLFSYISTNAIDKLGLIPAIIILIVIVLFGIITDIIGVAVTVGAEDDFHAKASKKIKGAKSSIKLIRNSAKVSNICCDVVGDVCSVISGAISAMIAIKLAEIFKIEMDINFLVSAVVAAVTVGTKSIGKEIGQKYSTEIVEIVGKLLNKILK